VKGEAIWGVYNYPERNSRLFCCKVTNKYDCVIVRTVSEIATPNKGTTDPQGFYGLSSLYLFADNASVNNNTCKCNQGYIEDQGFCNRGTFSANLTNEATL